MSKNSRFELYVENVGRRQFSAADLISFLSSDPAWVAKQEKLKERRSSDEEELKREQSQLTKDLRDIGCNVSSVWDLVNSSLDYHEAKEVLVKHLEEDYSNRTKEGIFRALTVKAFADAGLCKSLITQFKKQNDTSDNGLKWVLGNAISILATPNNHDEIKEIMLDSSHGRARSMIIMRAFEILPDELAAEILTVLLNDQFVGDFAAKALKSRVVKRSL